MVSQLIHSHLAQADLTLDLQTAKEVFEQNTFYFRRLALALRAFTVRIGGYAGLAVLLLASGTLDLLEEVDGVVHAPQLAYEQLVHFLVRAEPLHGDARVHVLPTRLLSF